MTRTMQDAVLTGPQKAAALLFVMGRPLAIRLMRQLEPGELRLVTQAATNLGPLTAQVIDLLAAEIAERLASGPDIRGSHDEAQALLASAFTPDQVAGILNDPAKPEPKSLWEALPALDDAALTALLDTQHPQVSAFLLTRLPSDRVARLLGLMPMPGRGIAMRRLLACGAVIESAVGLCEATLGAELAARTDTKTSSDRPARVASILNQMEPAHTEALLTDLAASRPKDADVLRGLMFSFDDIAGLSAKARGILLDKVPTDKLVLALRGTEQPLRLAVLSSLAARARRIVEAELAQECDVPQREIAKARRAIADIVLNLAERGEIELREPAADAA